MTHFHNKSSRKTTVFHNFSMNHEPTSGTPRPRFIDLGSADAPCYRDKEAPRGQQDQSKTTWKDTVHMILERSFRTNKGQPVNTVMKSTGVHPKIPDDHPGMLTDMCESY